MIWLNPWAWLGLIAIGAPILVHLLARRRAKPLLFPTLRFLGTSRPVLARRDRLSDLAVLAVRAAILAAAVAALAQPHLMTLGRQQQLNRTLVRSVLVDTSASMRRQAAAGGTAVDAARKGAERLAAEAATHRVQESTNPARELAGEVAWLTTQAGRRELVVISDFQTGSLTTADVASVPASIGVRLVRIDLGASRAPLELVSATGARETAARLTLTPEATSVEWTSRPRATGADGPSLQLLTDSREQPLAEAALDAARAMAPPPPSDRPVAIVFPGVAGRAALIKDAATLAEPWMFDVLLALRQNPLLTAVGGSTAGEGLVTAASDRVDGRRRLLLFSSAEAGSLASAALMTAVMSALSPAPPATELDPRTIADETLAQWERAPGSAAAPRADNSTTSDGRWLWALALLLLGLETWMRRTRRQSSAQQPPEATHARVA